MNEVFETARQTLIEGLEKQAGMTTEVATSVADEVLSTWEDLEKSANWATGIGAAVGGEAAKKVASGFGNSLLSVAAKRGAEALGGLAVAGLAGAAYLGAKKVQGGLANDTQYRAFMASVQKAKTLNSTLQRASDEKVARMADTVFKYAPTAAADPHLLASVLSAAVLSESGIDVQTIKMLVDLEKAHAAVHAPSTTFGQFIR